MTKADKLIFWGVLIVALVSFVFINVFIFSGGEKTAVIEVNQKPYAEYKLKDLTSPVILEIDTGSGYNKIEITKTGAKILSSDCRDKSCHGEITKGGQMLVCLPNKVVVKIIGRGEADGVAY
ncbi:MAG: NusG domain II-containing protein [Clostridia bacterium]|nr:NusG domain II-containing protein [Clostridia bacterium]